MKRLLSFSILIAILASCTDMGSGELTGVQNRKRYFEPEPYGMVFVPQGSFNMGPNDQDVAWAQNSFTKTISIDAFWMDETEITNNEYRQFVYWVRDSIMRYLLGQQMDDFIITEDQFGNPITPPKLNWETEIDLEDEEMNEIIQEMYYPQKERFWGRKEMDVRKLEFEYFWIDLKQAADKSNRWDPEKKEYNGYVINNLGDRVKVVDRSSFVLRDKILVYPDTLCWIADFTFSYNEPLATMYFWHVAYDNYPVVGVSWKQATTFCIWRTMYLNVNLAGRGEFFVHDYRLPIEGEWEYAARGGLDLSMYPWGGLYTRNKEGCFLSNFKPLRGNYIDDGSLATIRVGSYDPNEFGLYDMAGNVSEWTSSSYDESAYAFIHDMNPDYKYNAKPDDPPVMKRKVIRGGSWKDIGYFMQCGTRTYEYQDTAKSYIGFRCVRTYLGNS